MSATGFNTIEHIRYRFNQHLKPEYENVHKQLDFHFNSGLSDLDALFTTPERETIKQNVIDIIRQQITAEMQELFTKAEHPRIHQLVQNMPMSIRTDNIHSSLQKASHLQ